MNTSLSSSAIGESPPSVAPSAAAVAAAAAYSPQPASAAPEVEFRALRCISARLRELPVAARGDPLLLGDDVDDASLYDGALQAAGSEAYVGEPFDSFVVVENVSGEPLVNVSLRVELRALGEHITLDTRTAAAGEAAKAAEPVVVLDTGEAEGPQDLAPGQSLTRLARCNLTSAGLHYLITLCNYDTPRGRAPQRKRILRFMVHHAVRLASPRPVVPVGSGGLVVDFLAANASPHDLPLLSAEFVPTQAFAVRPLTPDPAVLVAGAKHSFAFRLDPAAADENAGADAAAGLRRRARGDAEEYLGTFTLVWRRAGLGVGERAVGSVSLRRDHKFPLRPPLEVHLWDVPERAVIERPFTVRCEVLNGTTGPVRPLLAFTRSHQSSMKFVSVSRLDMGDLAPGERTSVPLQVLPTECGLQRIRGIVVEDLVTNTRHLVSHNVELLVYNS